jgi:hypothetical protein
VQTSFKPAASQGFTDAHTGMVRAWSRAFALSVMLAMLLWDTGLPG